MTTISQLSGVSGAVSLADQLAVFNANSQTTRKVTVAQLQDAMESGFVPVGGILSQSTVYRMQGNTPSTLSTSAIAITLTASQLSMPSFTIPSGGASFIADPTTGRFIATRDVTAISFNFTVIGSWTTGVRMTALISIGDPGSPFNSGYSASLIGAGNAALIFQTLSANGIDTNQNDPLGIIKAGQVVQVKILSSSSDTFTISRTTFSIQTLDGK